MARDVVDRSNDGSELLPFPTISEESSPISENYASSENSPTHNYYLNNNINNLNLNDKNSSNNNNNNNINNVSFCSNNDTVISSPPPKRICSPLTIHLLQHLQLFEQNI